MIQHNLRTLVISLAVLTACTTDKGGDESSGVTNPDPSSSGDPTGDSTTSGDPTATTTSATDGDPTATTSGDPTATTTSATDGDPTGGTEGNPPCIDTPTVLAADEASALGFSGAELLADKLGKRETSLTFATEPLSLSDAWKGKVLPLTVELRHEGGEIRFVDSEPNPDYDDSGNESGFQECTDRVEVDVKFDFVTEAGELDEHHDAVLVATTVDTAQLRAELLPPGVMGSLDPTSLYGDPEWVVTGIEVGATWQGTLAGGSLLNEVLVGGDEGFAGFGSVAFWGDEGVGL